MQHAILGEHPNTVAEVIVEPFMSGVGVVQVWFHPSGRGKARITQITQKESKVTDYTEKCLLALRAATPSSHSAERLTF